MDARIREVLSRHNYQILPVDHPTLAVYAQNVDGRPALVIDVPRTVDRYIAGTKGVRVIVESKSEGQSFLRFESLTAGSTPMFEALVESLLDGSAEYADVDESLSALIDGFDDFKSMLAVDHGQLSEQAVRGLFAELAMLLELREAGYGAGTAIASWQGPYRAAKDFVLPDRKCIEVKSIRRQNHRLQISNLDQLDARGEELRLAALELDRRVDGNGMALDEIVSSVQTWAKSDSIAAQLLAQALTTVGLDMADPYYRQWRFDTGEWRWYEVRDGFPRIRADAIPAPITAVRYTIDLDQITDRSVGPYWAEEHHG